MNEAKAIARCEEAAALLPPRFRRAALQMPDHRKRYTEEFRLRAGQPPAALLPEGEVTLPYFGADSRVTPRVAVVDERGEIAVCAGGEAQMALGTHTDVLTLCPKAQGIGMVLRAMNPQVIAVDEITAAEDIAAMAHAANCGAALLATMHASGLDELRHKPLWPLLRDSGVFRRAVVIEGMGEERRYRVEELLP